MLEFNFVQVSGGPDYSGTIRFVMVEQIQKIEIQSVEGNTNLEVDNDTTDTQIARIDPGTPEWIPLELPSIGAVIKIGVNSGSYYHRFNMKITT